MVVLLPLTEGFFSGAAPTIIASFGCTSGQLQSALPAYLLGVSLGVFVWGTVSDRFGRKSCLTMGLGMAALASALCSVSASVSQMILFRCLQGFGASAAGTMGHAINRDVFLGKSLGRTYAYQYLFSAIFSLLVGPMAGRVVAQNFGWRMNFFCLIGFYMVTMVMAALFLPETREKALRAWPNVLGIGKRMVSDPWVVGCGVLIASSHAIRQQFMYSFSIFSSQGALYYNVLGSLAGGVALGTVLGRRMAHRPLRDQVGWGVVLYGTALIFVCTALVASGALTASGLGLWSMVFVSGAFGIGVGMTLTNSGTMAMALVQYRDVAGTASALFASAYQFLTFGFTALPKVLSIQAHTVYFYLLLISFFMFFVFKASISAQKE